MTKLMLALTAAAVLLAGLLLGRADATALTGAPNPGGGAKYSQVHKSGCLLAGRHCRAGFKWVCGPYAAPMGNRCRCAPC